MSSSWSDLEQQLEPAFSASAQHAPVSIDTTVLNPDLGQQQVTSLASKDRLTFFRERHGWCPYSERVWLTLELGNIDYDTIRIDNTGGPRPSYFAGQTPQIQWPQVSRPQSESMDLVYQLDQRYNLNLQSDNDQVRGIVAKFSSIFPKARPSSRAAFLFQNNGEPLPRSTFEATLRATEHLLASSAAAASSSSSAGPFFGGNHQVTVADIAWCPFLERYRYQLPCLHEGLEPDHATHYPHLAAWYAAMDEQAIPAYQCRVKGDASSWRKVLTMAGFGNDGVPPQIDQTMQQRVSVEQAAAIKSWQNPNNLVQWQVYAATRPYLAPTSPAAQAALVITRNRQAIVQDALKSRSTPAVATLTVIDIDEALRSLVGLLLKMDQTATTSSDNKNHDKVLQSLCQGFGPNVAALAAFLDQRMCVPRDMGSLSAACIKVLAVQLQRQVQA